METMLGVGIGIVVFIVALWLTKRRTAWMIPPQLAESMRLEKSDPVRSQALADEYFMGAAARDERERAELWQRAPSDLAAANELRRRYLEDIETDADAYKEYRKSGSPELLRTLEESQQKSRHELARLDTIIRALGRG